MHFPTFKASSKRLIKQHTLSTFITNIDDCQGRYINDIMTEKKVVV